MNVHFVHGLSPGGRGKKTPSVAANIWNAVNAHVLNYFDSTKKRQLDRHCAQFKVSSFSVSRGLVVGSLGPKSPKQDM